MLFGAFTAASAFFPAFWLPPDYRHELYQPARQAAGLCRRTQQSFSYESSLEALRRAVSLHFDVIGHHLLPAPLARSSPA